MALRVNDKVDEEQEWLEAISSCDGAEVPRAAWPIVEKLVARGLVTLGSPRGPGGDWRRAELVEVEDEPDHVFDHLKAHVFTFVRGLRGRRKNPVTRSQIIAYFKGIAARPDVEDALDALVAEGFVISGFASLRTPQNRARRTVVYESAS